MSEIATGPYLHLFLHGHREEIEKLKKKISFNFNLFTVANLLYQLSCIDKTKFSYILNRLIIGNIIIIIIILIWQNLNYS